MADQAKPKKQLDKRDLAIAAIGMLIGAAGGAAVHPLATQKPSAGGYAASAAVGAGLGAPTALLIANSMKNEPGTAQKVWGQIVDTGSGVLDSLRRIFTHQRYTKQGQQFKSEPEKGGQKIGNAIRSLLPGGLLFSQAQSAGNYAMRGGLIGGGALLGAGSGLWSLKKYVNSHIPDLVKLNKNFNAKLAKADFYKGHKVDGLEMKHRVARPGRRAYYGGLVGLLAGAIIDYFTNLKFQVYDK